MKSICPYCGHRHELVSAVTSKAEAATLTEEPSVEFHEANSVSFCIGCGESAIFADVPGNLRFPTFEEAMTLLTLEAIQKLGIEWHRSLQALHQQPRRIRNKPEWMK